MPVRPGRRQPLAPPGLLLACLGWALSAAAGDGGLPGAIGAARRGPEPAAGQWAEYRLALPLDPLEARLAREAAQAAGNAGAASAPAAPPPGPPDIHPPDRLPEPWGVTALRLRVVEPRDGAWEVELRTEAGSYRSLWAWPPAAEDGAAMPGGAPPSFPRTVAVDGAPLAVTAIPLGLPLAEGEDGPDPSLAGECWTSPEVPFGLVRYRTPEMDLVLVGFGRHDATRFPMERVGLPDGFPEGEAEDSGPLPAVDADPAPGSAP